MKKLIMLAASIIFVLNLSAQKKLTQVIHFPTIPGYETLVCDFHQHTVFSDGEIWPGYRVTEALNEGLDAISISDHIEYQPNKSDLPNPDRNRAYQIALKAADESGLLVVNGAEITRKMPPGHLNAIFIDDANKLITDDPIDAIRAAKAQGAFIFWNHPNWIAQKQNGVAELTAMHQKLIDEKLVDGIEIANGTIYSENAYDLALQHKLTILGSSDIHAAAQWANSNYGADHRPITLVFASNKDKKNLKESLFNARTVVWFKNNLFGKNELLKPLIENSISIEKTEVLNSYTGESMVTSLVLKNNSSAGYIFSNTSDYKFYNQTDIFEIEAYSTQTLEVKTLEKLEHFILNLTVLNGFISTNKNVEIELKVN